ncbi:TPA: maltose/maltodextrin ABC transporter substrate-binding protein MalE [Klebsiella pneumoniae]|uniref:maltose/maltodextrin ABC transporter substrate-binding protein MalE n=1 Tax=Enterobacteriaceae TaxID=543 RepID=UPI000666103A|nr:MULTISPECIES: maltose/maltodextrin ABC transporter substrate-binding protein MalE [Enterobacteriaceae]EBA1300418.1 maltose/maltodextrin ABC transporter substrate-binding protein MalE [Salmonella enterica]EKU3364562.1 maltose/maltodextrin ABC transporter substrate-binding protein MalE [Escherichia coli]HBT7665807.1 maltose/maltodextrin ABC transporter substrate-binding protein MalE [Klebsiella pneumoniae]HCJ6660647.1 maltose/maltodextrin ABC transporter substrate-binding protein MalE [Enterob
MKKSFMLIAACAAWYSATPYAAIQEGKLIIWGGSLGNGRQALETVGKRFEADTGIPVTVEQPKNIEERFPLVASSGGGPDIVIYAHDRFGGYAKSGLLYEVNPSPAFKEKIVPFAWDAVKYNGKLIGYPMSIEALTLIWNKKLIKSPPSTWEEIPAMDDELRKKGKKAITWNISEPYFTWPLIASAGGYVFKKTDNGYDTSHVGIDNEGAVKGLEFIVNMVKSGRISPDTDYPLAEASFNKGETAMIINGPWSWENIGTSGIDYGVTVLPTFQGQKARPFVGVVSIGINAASPNKELAVEFIENYLMTDEGLTTLNDAVPLGAVTLKSYQKKLEKDPRIQATMQSAENGEIMPNIPEMSSFWYAEKTAIINAINQKQSPESALNTAKERVLTTQP